MLRRRRKPGKIDTLDDGAGAAAFVNASRRITADIRPQSGGINQLVVRRELSDASIGG